MIHVLDVLLLDYINITQSKILPCIFFLTFCPSEKLADVGSVLSLLSSDVVKNLLSKLFFSPKTLKTSPPHLLVGQLCLLLVLLLVLTNHVVKVNLGPLLLVTHLAEKKNCLKITSFQFTLTRTSGLLEKPREPLSALAVEALQQLALVPPLRQLSSQTRPSDEDLECSLSSHHS